eukprot:TRINITY_DN2544_c0_g3_i1.p1 TRINITY_DN2544_c0_g3~~TRINITY_DN2544_c0_g3_i1.p1  ORF type:complete len:626 (+),score=148.06 TRINITY_DN2544_c0_g3_i1:559-2436(+)
MSQQQPFPPAGLDPFAETASNNFWNDIPDDVLNDIYNQIGNSGMGMEVDHTNALVQSGELQRQVFDNMLMNTNTQQLPGGGGVVGVGGVGGGIGGGNPLADSNQGMFQAQDPNHLFTQPGVAEQTFEADDDVMQQQEDQRKFEQRRDLLIRRQQLAELIEKENEHTRGEIQKVALEQATITSMIAQFVTEQRRVLPLLRRGDPSAPNAQQTLTFHLKQASQQINACQQKLRSLNSTYVLDAPSLHQCRVLAQSFQIQDVQLDLYVNELEHNAAARGGPVPCVAALVITDQPIPQVTFKGKILEDDYTVELLTGAGVELEVTSNVKANIIATEKTWKVDKPIAEDESPFSASETETAANSARFKNIKVNISTRMAPVHLQFSAQIKAKGGVLSDVQSNLSYPFIAITNESQWCDAAGKLTLGDAFAGEHKEVPWAEFCNAVQHHFLKATRQDPSAPVRPLSRSDMDYCHKRFFANKQVVAEGTAREFWPWFGQVVQTVRFKRHVANLWFQGLIHGIGPKDEINILLQNEETGTFLIRFSESYPGLFGVAYVDEDVDETVKHYLVKPEDTGSQKTLPDFIREKPQFMYILQVENNVTFKKYAKDSILHPYYSKNRKLIGGENGYVLL